jgi:hypothetical protein
MKDHDSVMIEIDWNYSPLHSFSFEGAIYPEDYNGLPVLSHQIKGILVDEFEIISISKVIFNSMEAEQLAQLIPAKSMLINLNAQNERDNHVSNLTIFPFQYDSVSGDYFKINFLEIAIKEKSKNPKTSNLRNSESPDNSVLGTGEWYKIPVTVNGIHKIDYNYLKDAGVNTSS